ncbi:hypothetical protein PMAYCL1PPCAC_03125, partial [Pristionchus mayeri]
QSQGQTFEQVGIILNNNVFAHGQLYVALSRARESEKVRLYPASRATLGGRNVVMIRNKVEQSILEPVPPGSLHNANFALPDFVEAEVQEEMGKPVRGGRRYEPDHSEPQSDRVKKMMKPR